MAKQFSHIGTVATHIIAQKAIDPNVVIGMTIPVGDRFLLTAYVGTHKSTAEKLDIITPDESGKEKLIELVAKGGMQVHSFDHNDEAVKCAAAIWPSTAGLR